MITQLLELISPKIQELNFHPIYSQINGLEKLRPFMERHVFAVFDFMSLAKALQNEFAPSSNLWLPPKNPKMARFINEVILGEESDLMFGDEDMPLSHFEIYLKAMNEVGANTEPILSFLNEVEANGMNFKSCNIPLSCREFISQTFNVIRSQKLNRIAAYFCFGREKIIPDVFQAILDEAQIDSNKAPIFHFYLERHIEVDSASHGPIALQMIEEICKNDEALWIDTIDAANTAISNRISFWDQILCEIK